MSLQLPFRRNYRAIKEAPNSGYSNWAYIADPEYAGDAAHHVRAYKYIQGDLERIFEYIEPSAEGEGGFSYRIHSLLIRTCIEIEANFRAILSENIFTPKIDRFGSPIYNMSIYKKIDKTHHLSSYELVLPAWNGPPHTLKPFAGWANGTPLQWYQAYNESKHDRKSSFRKANLRNLIDAVAGLLVVISSQFYTEDFSAGASFLSVEGTDRQGMEAAIGSMFRIRFPNDWSIDEMYDFDWSILKLKPNRFSKIDFNAI